MKQRYYIFLFGLLSLMLSISVQANPLIDYVKRKDATTRWQQLAQQQYDWGTIEHLQLVSQTWRGKTWQHHLVIVKPKQIRHPDTAFLFISGDGSGDKHLEMLKTLSQRSGTLAAVLMNVPNQPLYDGRKEDALIAYTFNQYLKTGDENWPLLFPMVKSVSIAMDVLQEYSLKNTGKVLNEFVVSGASKRGWTTWLTAAVDDRVKAIAPMVIDVLNMKPQLQWSEQVYGQQSIKIKDYTELNLHQKQDLPEMQALRSWVDPYEYKDLYTMPKLLLLGTNDPYWTVDSLRHYWHELPEPKLVYQAPNSGHKLNKEALNTLTAFYEMLVEDESLPEVNWHFDYLKNQQVKVALESSEPAKAVRLWTALSTDRDFRPEHWQQQTLNLMIDDEQLSTQLNKPKHGYKAYLLEMEFETNRGHRYKLSTEARVTPDTLPCNCWLKHNHL